MSDVVKEEQVLEDPEDGYQYQHHYEEERCVSEVGLELIVEGWDHFLSVG